MKTIPLSNGGYTIVDDGDYGHLMKWKWRKSESGYAVRSIFNGGHTKHIRMHRSINNTPDGLFTDHINGDRLDNRRSNLRSCTMQQNNMNKGMDRRNTSGVTGVGRKRKSWRARIHVSGVDIELGTFGNIEDAIRARREAELLYFGNFSPRRQVAVDQGPVQQAKG